MAESVFTKIIKRELPAEIVYEDDICIVILNIKANNPGHCLLITKRQVAEWLDLDPMELAHVSLVAQQIGKVLKAVYKPVRVELAIVGLEVAHTHLHIFPVYKLADADHSAAVDVSVDELQQEAARIRQAIDKQGGITIQ